MWALCCRFIAALLALPCARAPTRDPIYREHDWYQYRPKLSPFLDKDKRWRVPDEHLTPDFREEEPPFFAYKGFWYREEERPYRMSPNWPQVYRWRDANAKERPHLLGCYCTTVYKRYQMIAGCAVITTRHVLTTASSTELVLKGRRNLETLEDILGAWYDSDADVYNSSLYMTPARIHYHPRYIRTENLNLSHPIVGHYDLALWAATYPFYGNQWSWSKACVCQRGSSHRKHFSSSQPTGEMLIVVGFQYILAWKKKPLPWFKYALRTRHYVNPCPKTEWGWFHCVPGDWAKFGVEPGAALHRTMEGRSWRYDGLIGLSMFSMRLRSDHLIHYFHTLDTHPVLDFLYTAYMGRMPYEYLDDRFNDTKGRAPKPKEGVWIPWRYPFGAKPYLWRLPWD